jgi:glycosyltransferase involved in cell wall biosynthesis
VNETRPDRPLLSVVVPAYDERPTIAALLERVARAPYTKEIIVVDDASTDGTREFLESVAREDMTYTDAEGRPVRVRVLLQDRNRGKGAAVKRGFQAVNGEIVLVQDADLEYDPADYPLLVEPIRARLADVVYGSRFLGGPQRVHMFWHYMGNKLVTLLSNMLTNLKLSDMETGYKAFRREVVERIGPTLVSKRFGFEPEITAKVARAGYRIYETPIAYHGRDYHEGKKITWKDGLAAAVHIIRFRFSRNGPRR